MKVYNVPEIYIDKFYANENISVCGYKFTCNAGMAKGKRVKGEIWKDSNNNGKWDELDELVTGTNPLSGKDLVFTACNETHFIPTEKEPEFFRGFFTPGKGKKTNTKEVTDVLVWKEWKSGIHDGGAFRWHTHATTLLDPPKVTGKS